MWHNDCDTYVLLKINESVGFKYLNFVDLQAIMKTTKFITVRNSLPYSMYICTYIRMCISLHVVFTYVLM